MFTDFINKSLFNIVALIHTQIYTVGDMPIYTGYRGFHQVASNRKAGGISVYVKNSLNPIRISNFDDEEQKGLVWIHITCLQITYAIGVVYMKVVDGCRADEREDNILINDNLWREILRYATECYRNNVGVILCGDFNAHIGNDTAAGSIQNNPHANVNINGQNLINLCNELNLM